MKYSLFFLLQEGQSQLFATVNRNIDASFGYVTWQQDEKVQSNSVVSVKYSWDYVKPEIFKNIAVARLDHMALWSVLRMSSHCYKNHTKKVTTKGFVGRREEFLPEAHSLSRTVTAQIPLCVLGHSHYRDLPWHFCWSSTRSCFTTGIIYHHSVGRVGFISSTIRYLQCRHECSSRLSRPFLV